MQPQENPARVPLGLHGDITEGFLLKNLYCLECRFEIIHSTIQLRDVTDVHQITTYILHTDQLIKSVGDSPNKVIICMITKKDYKVQHVKLRIKWVYICVIYDQIIMFYIMYQILFMLF